jgi:hypothetical protein
MDDARRGKGIRGLRVCPRNRSVGKQRDDDELQTDQSAGRRPDNDVKIFPTIQCRHD